VTRAVASPYLDHLTMVHLPSRYARSRALYERACRVIPGGTHLSGRPLVDTNTTPMYFDRAQGCRIWDVDGNRYIDYLMAFGTYLLGYAGDDIDGSARAQGRMGRLLSMNHPLHIEFIEALLERFPGSDMGIFFKTGSEATTAAVRIARRHTGRHRIARCGLHGWHDGGLPREDFVPAGLDEELPEFDANRPETLTSAFERFPDEIAAVIVAPEMVVPHEPAVLRSPPCWASGASSAAPPACTTRPRFTATSPPWRRRWRRWRSSASSAFRNTSNDWARC
jgi:glutamate-1-semialdehyde 2,1-aminomutase